MQNWSDILIYFFIIQITIYFFYKNFNIKYSKTSALISLSLVVILYLTFDFFDYIFENFIKQHFFDSSPDHFNLKSQEMGNRLVKIGFYFMFYIIIATIFFRLFLTTLTFLTKKEKSKSQIGDTLPK